MNEDVLLEVRDLKTHFPMVAGGVLRRIVGSVRAVDGVSLYMEKGETYGLVGESGCGKSTLAHTIMGGIKSTAGQILLYRDGSAIDIAKANRVELRNMRQHMQIVMQDPFSSLNPRMTIRDIVGEPLVVNTRMRGPELEERVIELLRDVGLKKEHLIRYPHSFSGGQRQRISIARALALNPRIIIGDEPVSALDVSVQAQVLNLFQILKEQFHLTYLLITHDLSVIEHMCERVAIMYLGRIVEEAPTDEVFFRPRHPYAEALLSAIPVADPHVKSQEIVLEGEVADPSNPPAGCYFHPRCRYASEKCRTEYPEMKETGTRHGVACHRAEELDLAGAQKSARRVSGKSSLLRSV